MSYVYVKQKPVIKHRKKLSISPKKRKVFAGIFFCIGLYLFTSAVFPIIQFQIEYSRKFNQLVNPLSTKFYNRSGNILGELTTDYTQISNWFEANQDESSTKSLFSNITSTQYTIDIPTIKVKDAVVEVGSMDLKKSLIQWPQTALPGQPGNAVVFGHSVLPQFFNPKSYLTIFSTLYKLKQGDEIFVSYDNVQYRYLVEEMYEVQPTDLSVLEQRFDGRYITLITCTPPGTYLRRLVVKARIVDL